MIDKRVMRTKYSAKFIKKVKTYNILKQVLDVHRIAVKKRKMMCLVLKMKFWYRVRVMRKLKCRGATFTKRTQKMASNMFTVMAAFIAEQKREESKRIFLDFLEDSSTFYTLMHKFWHCSK